MTSPSGGISAQQQQQQNGTTPPTWDPSTTSSTTTSLNGSNLQQPFPNFWSNPNYFSANSSFGSTNSYPTDQLSYNTWASNYAAATAAASAADPRFPKLNVPTGSTFNPSNIPFMASLTAASMAGNALRNSRRRRNLFSQNQVNELKRAFDTEPYVKPETRERLAAKTGLTPQQVKIWFQNNRYKCKQKTKEDERMHNRTSTSFNDSGSTGSPSSSGNELSMTATNSPDIKHNLANDSFNKLNLANDNSMIHPMVHTQDLSADVKPIYHHPDIQPPFNYPMNMPYPYNGYGNLMYPYQVPSAANECFSTYFTPQPQQAANK